MCNICNQSWSNHSVWSLINFHSVFENNFKELLKRLHLTKMNCCFKSGIYKQSPNCRVNIEVLHFIRRLSIVLSHNRIDFVHAWHDFRGYEEIMWPFPSFSLRIPWIFWNTGCRRFHRAGFVCNKLTCYFILVNAPGFRFIEFPHYLIILSCEKSCRRFHFFLGSTFFGFAWLFINLVNAETDTGLQPYEQFHFYGISTRTNASVHMTFAYKYLSNDICTIVEEWTHRYFCLGYFFSSTHFDLVTRVARKVWRQCVLVFVVHDRHSHAGNCSGLLSNTGLFLSTGNRYLFRPQCHTFPYDFWPLLLFQVSRAWRQSFIIEVSDQVLFTMGFELVIVGHRYLLMNLHVVQF